MYETFYGLKEKPFKILPDPDYLYMSQGHENAYTHLEYAVAENKGFVVITGEIGSGKTTLINFLLSKIRQDIHIGLINNTYVPPKQFMKMICQEFELEVDGMDKTDMVDVFHDFLLRQFAERKRVTLIIDEAQNLMPKTMEELRMLSNLEAEKHHLVQMVLVGQPELKYKLQRKDLEQFAQRVTVHCHLNGLKRDEVDEYIRYRLKVGGAENPELFDDGAVGSVARYSRGIPRLINIICDTALVYGYADGLKTIGEQVIESVVQERELGGISFEDKREEKRSSSVAALESAIAKSFENRLEKLETRIQGIEELVAGLDEGFQELAKKRDERDSIVLELFRMIKDSMESRWNILLSLNQIRKRMDMGAGKALEDKKGPKAGAFYRLNLKRRR